MTTTASAPEQRMLLHHISWDTYERLLRDHENSSAPRFAYDRGTLEIMSPLPIQEQYGRAIETVVEAAAEALGLDWVPSGSTTFRRADLERGFEPDACFYIQHAGRIRGRDRIDLTVDPPPDLVIEVDLTSPSLDKLPLYAAIRVPEVWRYDGDTLEIRVLDGDRYRLATASRALRGVTAEAVAELVAGSGSTSRPVWLRRVRRWADQIAGGPVQRDGGPLGLH